ncbi:MAG: CFI-box-CTERM domain-containing protein [Candidatus Bathyarchaeia archaeon]|jgi:very-short-patch-repair endonuclease
MYRRHNRISYQELKDRASEMRNNPTRAEAKMYEILYSDVVPNYPEHKFYRQSVQYPYILDFYCPTLRLGIEVDGDIHDNTEAHDRYRDARLQSKNIQVYRFSNDEVLYNPQKIVAQLRLLVQDKTTPYQSQDAAVQLPKTYQNQSNCFIATAAYGTTKAKELDVLRKFRDVKLESNLVGRRITILYYLVSPPIANIIARSKEMRAIVRECLNPIINFLKRKWC